MTHQLRLLIVNCRSLRNKVDDFHLLLSSVQPAVVLGTESWLDATILDRELFPLGYHCFRRDRESRGGGVFILVSSDLPCVRVVCDLECESVFCKLRADNGECFLIGSYYRPPGASCQQFAQLTTFLETVQCDHIILGGDFNLPGLDWGSSNFLAGGATGGLYTAFFEFMHENSLHQLVTDPSRNDDTGNVLDLLLCDAPNIISNICALPGISDHNVIVADATFRNVCVSKKAPRTVYAYNRANYAALNLALESYFPTFDTLADELNGEELWGVLKKKLFELRAKFVPLRTLSSKSSKDKPWFNRQLSSLLRKIRRIYRLSKTKKSDSRYAQLVELKRSFRELAGSAKQTYFTNLGQRLVDDPKEFWKYVKRNGKNDTSVPPLHWSDRIINDDPSKVEIFVNYFSSVFQSNFSDASAVRTVDFSVQVDKMPEVAFSATGVERLLQGLKHTKASGPDDIPASFLINCSGTLCLYLCRLFQNSLNDGIVPGDWKLARVVPIHKSGQRDRVENYRPVSLTSIVCKVMEHVIYSSIMSHLVANNLLHPSQHGFRQGFSCTTQLVEFTHDLASAVDKQQSVDCIFLDFRKAFDVVAYSLLIGKLRHYELDDRVFAWIAQYLRSRKMSVSLDGCSSTYVSVTSGVPQGSVLGPLLFLLFASDITLGITSSFRMFADDCIVYRAINSDVDKQALQNDLDLIVAWCEK